MDSIVVVALIVACSTVPPLAVQHLRDRSYLRERRREREEDKQDRDDVANKAAAATRELAANAKSAAVTAQKTLEIATETQGVAITTHGLVNSKMTEVKEVALMALKLALDVIGGKIPTPEEIERMQQQVSELKTELAGRAATLKTVEKEAKEAKEAKEGHH